MSYSCSALPFTHIHTMINTLYKKSKVSSDDMLSLVIPFSRSKVLARFEQTSKGTRAKVTESMIEFKTIENSLVDWEFAKQSAKYVKHPNSNLLHYAEINTCMICKEAYHGGFHPDFGVFVHKQCIKNYLVPVSKLVDGGYPVKDMLKQLPFTGGKSFYFLRETFTGFPAFCSVAEWDLRHIQADWDADSDYAFSNSQSLKIIKKIDNDAWDKQFIQAMNTATGTSVAKIVSIMKILQSVVRKQTKEVITTMRDLSEEVETAVLYVQKVVDMCKEESPDAVLVKMKTTQILPEHCW